MTQSTLFSASQPCSHPVNPVLTQSTLSCLPLPSEFPVGDRRYGQITRLLQHWGDHLQFVTGPRCVFFIRTWAGIWLTLTGMTDGHLRKQLNFLCMLHIPLTDTLYRLHESSVIEPQLSHQTFCSRRYKKKRQYKNTNQKTGTCR